MKTFFLHSISALLLVLLLSCQKEDLTTTTWSQFQLESRAPIEYNEGLVTTYRGVKISWIIGISLGIPSGYYRIREFRVLGSPEQKAITLNILKHYGENVNQQASVQPKSNEPYVFTKFITNIWQPHYREIKVKDEFNHILYIKATYDSIKSCWNTVATINSLSVTVSYQTYTTSVLNTCGFVEPAWTEF